MGSKVSYEVLEQVDFDTDVKASDYSSFMESAVWRDLESVVLGQVARAQLDLESAVEVRDIFYNQGQIAAYKTLLTLPKVIFETLTEMQKGEHQDARTE